MPRQTKVTRTLECIIEDDKYIEYSKELAGYNKKMLRLDNEKKSYNKQIGYEISKVEASIQELSDKVGTGKEMRDIDCEVKYDWDKGEKTIIRLDLNEIVTTDIITETEKQMEIELTEKENKDKENVETEEEKTGEPAETATGDSENKSSEE